MRFRISVRTIQGNDLTFTVEKFDVSDGFVIFRDSKTQIRKWFHSSNCEIQEVD